MISGGVEDLRRIERDSEGFMVCSGCGQRAPFLAPGFEIWLCSLCADRQTEIDRDLAPAECVFHSLCRPAGGRCGFENLSLDRPIWGHCARYLRFLQVARDAGQARIEALESGASLQDLAYIADRWRAEAARVADRDQGAGQSGDL